jgi:hypothetical protein
MAAEEHLQIVRQSVDVWNEWRRKNPELIPDLSKAELRETYLSGANLGGKTPSEIKAGLSKRDVALTV